METPAPPGMDDNSPYPGVFIRAPAILSAGEGVKVLGKVLATPCSKAHTVLQDLEEKIENLEELVEEQKAQLAEKDEQMKDANATRAKLESTNKTLQERENEISDQNRSIAEKDETPKWHAVVWVSFWGLKSVWREWWMMSDERWM